jgi:hypothetical protein
MLSKNLVQQLFGQFTGGGEAGFFSGFSKLFGFAGGGDFTVGGTGGTDSQLVAFRASPDERVSVSKPGAKNGGTSGGDNAGATPSIVLSPVYQFAPGMTPGDVARMIAAANEQFSQAVPTLVAQALRINPDALRMY